MSTTAMTPSTEGALSDSALLGLLQLTSPALPIGGFAWSQGLETAVDLGWVDSDTALEYWLAGVLSEGLAHTDLALLVRLHDACHRRCARQFRAWNQYTLACRETRELHEEDTQMGAALIRVLRGLDLLPEWPALPSDVSYLSAFALAAVAHGVTVRAALTGLAWSWLENQLAVACKTVPIGHTAAQRIQRALHPAIITACDLALACPDEQIGTSLPGVALASCHHETQYTRLFRS
ncbi:MAG: urease accessory protein UreF [Gammaproteobacteria bacterium]|nr:MAG: urease accessory protein UreF [Gammaproteobacteria bacterium]